MANVAQTILEQLGGNKFCTMTGAKNLVNTGAGLQFSIGRGARNGINKVKITLQRNDLYTIEFFKVRGVKVTEFPLATAGGLYADKLAEHFTDVTGFDTRL